MNNTYLETFVFKFRGDILRGGALKDLWMTHEFCIEKSFSPKYISDSIQNLCVIQGIFTAPPMKIATLNFYTQRATNVLYNIFLQN